jgi:23S rRNA (guanosine2251-2'-O)-methyltransferase
VTARGADVVYGRNPVAEALVGRRRVRELFGTERGLAALGPLPAAAPSARVVSPAALDERAGSRDHQGVVALADPYPYVDADALLEAERPLIVALDEITDPQNLGAVARSAECAGADGLVIPRHRSAVVTPAVCKASAGAVEHLRIAVVRISRTGSSGRSGRGSGAGRRPRRPGRPTPRSTLRTGAWS